MPALLAGDWRVTRGVINITGVACTALHFHWWRSGNITRTQNVSEYMLVLALCLVIVVIIIVIIISQTHAYSMRRGIAMARA